MNHFYQIRSTLYLFVHRLSAGWYCAGEGGGSSGTLSSFKENYFVAKSKSLQYCFWKYWIQFLIFFTTLPWSGCQSSTEKQLINNTDNKLTIIGGREDKQYWDNLDWQYSCVPPGSSFFLCISQDPSPHKMWNFSTFPQFLTFDGSPLLYKH